ncbi:MAG: chemotaxis protein CheW [Gemmatimonadetes bacterium]|nr:chemotaxis protein CheW [Gemmatimonadota bacterium]
MARGRKGVSAPVDWAEIRRRVDAAGRALAGQAELSSERARAMLDERARMLARAPEAPRAGALELLTFTLAGEVYAVESRYVVEVFRLRELAALPAAEPPVFGVTAWRGELLTILDLRPVLDLASGGLDDLSLVLVLGEDRPAFGVLAGAVHDLVRLDAAAVREPPPGVAVKREYLRGVTADAVIVLEATALLERHA